MTQTVYIGGVGMTPFVKPSAGALYLDLGQRAATEAIEDAGIAYDDIEQAFVGYVYGDSTAGQAALYQVGLTGIPVVNVNNNCASGSSALFLAHQAIASGAVDCALALGFEQMAPGALADIYSDRPSPLKRFVDIADEVAGGITAPMAIKLFGAAGKEYQDLYGTKDATFAKISVKARRHARDNHRAIFRDAVTEDEVLAAPQLLGPLTRYQACPPTCGGAAVVLMSEDFARRRGLNGAVRVRGLAMTTDATSSFEAPNAINAVGFDMARTAANKVYEAAGIGPDEVDVVELHDCFTSNELLSYEALGLTPVGTAEKFIEDGDNTYGGKVVTNPSGGLLSKGHPLGATGLAQISELTWQLRGEAGSRQVEDANIAVQHNIGIGGACVVTMLEAPAA